MAPDLALQPPMSSFPADPAPAASPSQEQVHCRPAQTGVFQAADEPGSGCSVTRTLGPCGLHLPGR